MKKAMALLVVTAVLVMVAVPALAADDESSNRLDPESPFFFLQLIVDEVVGRLTTNAAERAHFVADLLQIRIHEIESMAERGRPDLLQHLADRTARMAGDIDAIFDQMVENGDEMDVAEVVANATLEAETALEGLLDEGSDIPDEAREGLQTALDAVENGRNRALDVLEAIANGEFPGNREQAQSALDELVERFGDLIPDAARERLGPPFQTDEEPGNGE